MTVFKRLFYKNRKFYDDDFDWDNYTDDSYERRVTGDVEANFTTHVKPEQAQIDFENKTVRLQGCKMHPNHQLILDAIVSLGPDSVHEVGCGGGDHVANTARLFPDIRATGGDRSESQLAFATKRHPELVGHLGVQDITMPYSKRWPTSDLVYSQAVLMHIHTAVSHFVGLANMVQQARRYVLLVENVQCHNLIADIQALHENGHLAWDTLHIHRFDGSTGARAILLSREALDFPVVTNDVQIREGLKSSTRRLKRAEEDSARGQFGFDQSF